MAENSKIQWTTHTMNPWRGCTKVAAGCANCYADRQSKRNPKTLGIWGPDGTRVVASEATWREPLKWNKAAENVAIEASQHNHRFTGDLDVEILEPHSTRVFCASLADVFEDWGGGQVRHSSGVKLWQMHSPNGHPEQWGAGVVLDDPDAGEPLTLTAVRRRLFRLIDSTTNLDWLLLTKRPENIRRMIPAFFPGGYIAEAGRMNQEGPRQNLWLGTSIACQDDAERNIPALLKCRDLAPVLFLSLEPLIGPVDLRELICGSQFDGEGAPLYDALRGASYWHNGDHGCHGPNIDWVICGGESGPKARPCHVDWIRSIVRQCREADVPCFVKQLGAFPIDSSADGVHAADVGAIPDFYRLASVTDPKGGNPDEWPEDLRVRQFPVVAQ